MPSEKLVVKPNSRKMFLKTLPISWKINSSETNRLQKEYKYYLRGIFFPYQISFSEKTYSRNNVKLFPYILTHIIYILQLAHNLLLFLGFYNSKFGPLNTFSKLDTISWLLTYSLPILADFLLFQPSFHYNICQLATLQNNLVNSEKDHNLQRKSKRIAWHNRLLDYFQISGLPEFLYTIIRFQTNFYSVLPWQNDITLNIFGVWQVLAMTVYFFNWSFVLTFPGICSYHLEAILKDLSNQFDLHSKHDILAKYKAVYLVQYFLSRNWSICLLFLYIALGIQQFIACYVIFQMIGNGIHGQELWYILIDFGIVFSRVMHSFYALSFVQVASLDFRARVTRRLVNTFSKLSGWRDREFRKILKSLKPMSFRLGPIKCGRGFMLGAASTFVQYYIIAALWE